MTTGEGGDSARSAVAKSLTVEDVAQMRRQGDYRALMRHVSGHPGKGRRPAGRPAPDLGGRVPGAWPEGSCRPTPRHFPEDVVREALDEYRMWRTAGRPKGQFRCDCGCVDPAESYRVTGAG